VNEQDRAAWAAAFVAAQAEFPAVPKNKTATIPMKSGGRYSYQYADLADILTALQPVLSKHGLAQAQSVEATDGQVSVTTRIYHSSGHVESFGPVGLRADVGAQAAGSAITYARRYALCAALGITPDEADDDGALATQQAQARTQAPLDDSKVCPVCAFLCEPVSGASDKLPKWRCTNKQCGGGKDGRPWASWQEDPWKSGGEIETKFGTGPAVTAAGPKADKGTPVDTASPSQSSPDDFARHLSLIEQAAASGIFINGSKASPARFSGHANRLALRLDLPLISEPISDATHLAAVLSKRDPKLAAAIIEDLGLEALMAGVAS
jgi:hypothetical protein